MGGKKKIGLKQMERMQSRQDEGEKAKDKKKEKAGPPKEKRTIGVIAPDVKNEKYVNEIKKMNLDLSSWTTPPDSTNSKSIQVEPDESKTKTVDTPNKLDDSNDVI